MFKFISVHKAIKGIIFVDGSLTFKYIDLGNQIKQSYSSVSYYTLVVISN
jgi:hypothetical protein